MGVLLTWPRKTAPPKNLQRARISHQNQAPEARQSRGQGANPGKQLGFVASPGPGLVCWLLYSQHLRAGLESAASFGGLCDEKSVLIPIFHSSFYGSFPAPGNAHKFSVIGIFDRHFCDGGKEGIVPEGPEHRVSVRSRSLIPCNPGTPPAGHQNPETSNVECLWRCPLCMATSWDLRASASLQAFHPW